MKLVWTLAALLLPGVALAQPTPLPVTIVSGGTFTGAITASTAATASTAPTAVLAGVSKPLNISLFSELFATPSIGGVPLVAAGSLGDAGNGSTSLGVGNLVWNGTTWDRMKGSVAGGVVVVGSGTAGSAAAGVTTVQGIASMTPILVSGTGTAGTAASAVTSVQGIASMTPLLANPGTAANWGVAATGAANPANAVLSGVNTNNLTTAPHICGSTATVSTSSATDTQLVAVSGSKTIYVCDYEISTAGANNVYLEKATTGTCATLTKISQTWYGGTATNKTAPNAYYRGLNTGASAQLCVNTTTTAATDITVYYDQY